jgi:V/A-type H+-transporting ATPase subunit E
MSPGTIASQGSGVQELIDRIRQEGIASAQTEAEKILNAAREEAAVIRSTARAEAEQVMQQARAQVATDQAAGAEALKVAARDTLLEMRANIRKAFEQYVQRLVSAQTRNPEFVRSLVLVLAGEAAEKFIKDKSAQIFVAAAIAAKGNEAPALTPEQRQNILNTILGVSSDMLREGVDLFPDSEISGGARVRLVDEKVELNLTDTALTRVLLKYLLPRYAEIVKDDAGIRG